MAPATPAACLSLRATSRLGEPLAIVHQAEDLDGAIGRHPIEHHAPRCADAVLRSDKAARGPTMVAEDARQAAHRTRAGQGTRR